MPTSGKTFSFGQLDAYAEIAWLGHHAPYSVLVRLGQSSAVASCAIVADAQRPSRTRLQTSFCKRAYAQGAVVHDAPGKAQAAATDLAYADFLQSIFEPVVQQPSALLQLHVQVLEEDPRIDIKLAAALAASLCLSLTGQVSGSPKALVQLAVIDGRCQINPLLDVLPSAQADLWVLGDSQFLLHIDGSARELDEALLISALEAAHRSIKEVSQALRELADLGKPERGAARQNLSCSPTLQHKVRQLAAAPLSEIFSMHEAETRQAKYEDLHRAVQLALCLDDDRPDYLSKVSACLHKLSGEMIRSRILNGNRRLNQRTTEQLRSAGKIDLGQHSRAHGSANVTLANAMILTTATLGKPRTVANPLATSVSDGLSVHVHLHSQQPGATAASKAASDWLTQALRPVTPSLEQFPYLIQLDCEHWGDLSTSRQDTLYTATLALMDAGVPIKAPVAAVELGLLCAPAHFITLSDPDDMERAACDITAALAGTQAGLTGIQIRSHGVRLSQDILTTMLRQARQNRLELLLRMSQVLEVPRRRQALPE